MYKDSYNISAIIISIFLIIIILYQLYRIYVKRYYSIHRDIYVNSTIDGIQYRVNPSYTHAQTAANMIAEINHGITDIIRLMRNIYIKQEMPPPILPNPTTLNMGPYVDFNRCKDITVALIKRYNPDNLFENPPHDPTGDTSYTYNKGEVMAFCIRDINSGNIQTFDVLYFVALHELAHLAITTTDHDAEFWYTFRFLLYLAYISGIYKSPNFSKNPVKYCNNMVVSYNPLWSPLMND